MKKRFFQFLLLATLTGVILSSCKKDDNEDEDNNVPTKNIVEILQEKPDFSILIQALNRSDLSTNYVALLSGNGPFTFFAPTNAAFQEYLSLYPIEVDINSFPKETLEEILKYHIISSEKIANSFSQGQLITTLQGSTITIGLSGGLNLTDTNGGKSMILESDINGTNGVIHTINKVIIPEFSIGSPPNIIETLQQSINYSTLLSFINNPNFSTNYATLLSGDDPFTVFAPTNAAFQDLENEIGATFSEIPTATLEEILRYHIVSGKVLAGSLTEGQVVTTLQGGTFTIGLSGGAKITDGQARVSNITTTDLEATNGVIHVVDKVILP